VEHLDKKTPHSVHLCDLPKPAKKAINQTLGQQMQLIRDIAEAGNRARRDAGIKVRQPLSSLSVKLKPVNFKLIESQKADLENLLRDELNVKKIIWQSVEKLEQEPLVELDTTITPELLQEGLARELIRHIQRERQKLGLNVSDKVTVTIDTSEELKKQVIAWENHIKGQTGIKELLWKKIDTGEETKINEEKIKIKVKKF